MSFFFFFGGGGDEENEAEKSCKEGDGEGSKEIYC